MSDANKTKRVLLDEQQIDQGVTISLGLSQQEEAEMISFLRRNKDVFVWIAYDLTGVSKSIIEHKLNAQKDAKSKK